MHFFKFTAYLFLSTLVYGILLADSNKVITWTDSQLAMVKNLSIKTLKPHQDPSNKYSSNSQVIALGKRLFHEELLSANQNVSCATCHIESQAFTDNKLIATGSRIGKRNTPTLFNVDQQDWFFWDGRADSLWAQALNPLEDPSEHNFTRTEVLHFISENKDYREQYEKLFNEKLPSLKELNDYSKKAGPSSTLQALKQWKELEKSKREKVNKIFSNIGKAIAAYVSTIRSPPTRFDEFVDQLIVSEKTSSFSQSEQRGLKLFISPKIGCINCHSGAIFSNKTFHNIGTGIQGKDNGRSEIVDLIIHDTFNCIGKYSDIKKEQCLELKYLNRNRHALAGSFKTPTLRGVSKTEPYMHDGRYQSLEAVLRHYSSIDNNKARQTDLPEMALTKQDQKDIISFLLTL